MNIEIKGLGKVDIQPNESCYDILKDFLGEDHKKYLIVKINNVIKDLTFNRLKEGDKVEFLDIKNEDGMRVYVRTLSLIYIKACKDLYNGCNVVIEHSLNKGLFSEIKINRQLTNVDINNIINRMNEIIQSETKIHKKSMPAEKAIEIFKNQKMYDKVSLLETWDDTDVRVYELDGYYDTFYGYVGPNTNVIHCFDVKRFLSGVILRFPTKDNINDLPEYVEHVKIAKIFDEAEEWGKIMDVSYVGALNKIVKEKNVNDLILINEALHEKKIAYIADEISENKDVKMVLIAGPSSSGKTSFAHRLSIQLQVNGKKTHAISLDDYFVDREFTPRDEDGNYNFDTIDALDIEKFNEDLIKLMAGEEVVIPTFDFKQGKRVYDKEPVRLTDEHIMVIEGIHGLNDKLTAHIDKNKKFKIYISALTQLNIDNHNRISTADTRLIRRIVRDNQFRGHNALRTMEMWDNVRKGEEKYIFPFQENADAMFNSSLNYELCLLKRYAVPLLKEVPEDSEFYPERQRLLKFLSYFAEIDGEGIIPNTSIVKEFIGGSILVK